MEWYIIHTHSNSEKRVASEILERIQRSNLEGDVSDVVVPTEEYIQVQRGKKVKREKVYYPGYVFVRMNHTDEVWRVIRSIPKVSRFLSSGGVPTVVSQKKVDKILKLVESSGAAKCRFDFSVGEVIKIIDGPFDSFTGIVKSFNEEKETLEVDVSIFNRVTPIELNIDQVVKV